MMWRGCAFCFREGEREKAFVAILRHGTVCIAFLKGFLFLSLSISSFLSYFPVSDFIQASLIQKKRKVRIVVFFGGCRVCLRERRKDTCSHVS